MPAGIIVQWCGEIDAEIETKTAKLAAARRELEATFAQEETDRAIRKRVEGSIFGALGKGTMPGRVNRLLQDLKSPSISRSSVGQKAAITILLAQLADLNESRALLERALTPASPRPAAVRASPEKQEPAPTIDPDPITFLAAQVAPATAVRRRAGD